VNNFLSVVTTRAELALSRDDPALARRSLEAILAQARELTERLREERRTRT